MLFAALAGLAAELTDTRLLWAGARDALFYVGLVLIGVRLGHIALAFILPAAYLGIITVGGAAGSGTSLWWVLPAGEAASVPATVLALGVFMPAFIAAVWWPPTSDQLADDVS